MISSGPGKSHRIKKTVPSQKSKESPRNKEKYSFASLQSSILLNIFKNLSEEDLINSVLPVCQSWRYVAMDPSLWKQISVVGNATPSQYVCRKIRNSSELEIVYIKRVAAARDIIKQAGRNFRNLRKLTIRYCEGIEERLLLNLTCVCVHLESLDLKGTEFAGSKFYEQLSRVRNLKSINLSANKLLKKSNVFSVVLNCRSLQEFILSEYTSEDIISEPEWGFIINSMSPRLRSIYLDGSSIGNFAFHSILYCPHIEKIGFHRAYNLGNEVLYKMVEHEIRLRAFHLRYAHLIHNETFTRIFSDAFINNIESIDLTGCWKLKDAALEAIAGCKILKSLILKDCKSISNIDPIVEDCSNLQVLNIAFCKKLRVPNELVSMPALKVLFIDHDKKFCDVLEAVMEKNLPIKIKVCESEFNKLFRPYRINKDSLESFKTEEYVWGNLNAPY